MTSEDTRRQVMTAAKLVADIESFDRSLAQREKQLGQLTEEVAELKEDRAKSEAALAAILADLAPPPEAS